MKKNNMPLFAQLLMPVMITILCGGIIFLFSIRPYEKIKTYLNIIFMDNSVSQPSEYGMSGLNIKEMDIDTEYTGELHNEGEIIYPEYATQYAIIECKSLDMYVPVYFGTGAELLEKGACNSPSSAVIGDKGNTVISAHVNTFFHNLSEINTGDIITLYTKYGKFTYSVSEIINFNSTDKSYLQMTEENILTVYTCQKDLFSSYDRIGAIYTLDKQEFY